MEMAHRDVGCVNLDRDFAYRHARLNNYVCKAVAMLAKRYYSFTFSLKKKKRTVIRV
jgi:hypothetical protein